VAWRVHATAAAIYEQLGDAYLVKFHSQVRDDILLDLADSLAETEPLHSTILRHVQLGKPTLNTI